MKQYTEEATAFYKSSAWRKTRELYIQSVGGMCERCRAKGKFSAGKIVHHRIYLDGDKLNDPRISLCFSNLELLCQDCHNEEHHAKNDDIRYAFDSMGRLIEKR